MDILHSRLRLIRGGSLIRGTYFKRLYFHIYQPQPTLNLQYVWHFYSLKHELGLPTYNHTSKRSWMHDINIHMIYFLPWDMESLQEITCTHMTFCYSYIVYYVMLPKFQCSYVCLYMHVLLTNLYE
ncbi:unnamed protein product [Orchesella dallaii]|uniref:Uncharacterized protein n=1 Tax=Orchesella dallaii TaxID=48710 RepID=A0ABP1QM88_9HEXA